MKVSTKQLGCWAKVDGKIPQSPTKGMGMSSTITWPGLPILPRSPLLAIAANARKERNQMDVNQVGHMCVSQSGLFPFGVPLKPPDKWSSILTRSPSSALFNPFFEGVPLLK